MSKYMIHTTADGAAVLATLGVAADCDYTDPHDCLYGWGEPVFDPSDDDYADLIGTGPCKPHYVSERVGQHLARAAAGVLVGRGIEAVVTDADEWSKRLPEQFPIMYADPHQH